MTWLWSALSGAAAAAPAEHSGSARPPRSPSTASAPSGKRPVLTHLQAPLREPRMRPVLVMPRRETFDPVDLIVPNTNTRLQFRPYDSQGRLRPQARRELSHLLRCPHTGAEHPVDQRLIPVLYRLGRHFGKPVVISSGYRPPELSTRSKSRHMQAAAVDFFIPGVDNGDLVRWLRQTFHPLGVGFYPDGVHVHLDVDRQRDTYWVQGGSDALHLGERLTRSPAQHHRAAEQQAGPDRAGKPARAQARTPQPERRKPTPSGRPPRK